jgi:pyruvate/2-oxoacid:ferredoxin oxidoreductase alpha subunit
MKDTRIITANEAAAQAAALCNVQVIAAYPITPQTPVTEELASMVETGELSAEYLTVESEHSAMASVIAASQVGARVFTASSANGLLYMHEMLHWAAGSRVPVVMACVNRGVGAPWTILNDQQDSISQRDTGWIQLYSRNSQEVLDTIIQAYRIAETACLPVMVCYDGFVLSHLSAPVEIPDQDMVNSFVPKLAPPMDIGSGEVMNINPLILSDPRPDAQGVMKPGYMELRRKLQDDLLSALDLIEAVDNEFSTAFGRKWGSPVWDYRIDDAEHILVSMGSLASELTLAADELRDEGLPVGVVGVKAYRPFPSQALCSRFNNADRLIVVEKDISYGYRGALASDIKAALFDQGVSVKVSDFIAGLGGRDVRPEQLADTARSAIKDGLSHGWINLK